MVSIIVMIYFDSNKQTKTPLISYVKLNSTDKLDPGLMQEKH